MLGRYTVPVPRHAPWLMPEATVTARVLATLGLVDLCRTSHEAPRRKGRNVDE